jgi:hypothetical protein
METAYFSETSVDFQRPTRRYIPEDGRLQRGAWGLTTEDLGFVWLDAQSILLPRFAQGRAQSWCAEHSNFRIVYFEPDNGQRSSKMS